MHVDDQSFRKVTSATRPRPRIALACATISACVALAAPQRGRAEGFEFTWHAFSASGTANVFDGGPPVSGSVNLAGPDFSWPSLTVSDFTQPGSMGAHAVMHGSSLITTSPTELTLDIEFDAVYTPSFFPGGDRPGGRAEGEMLSIVEFALTNSNTELLHELELEASGGFSGTTLITIENVTQSIDIRTIDTPTSPPNTFEASPIPGQVGNLIRVTTQIQGSGQIPGGVVYGGQYDTELFMKFVPEPPTVKMLSLGILCTAHGLFTIRN